MTHDLLAILGALVYLVTGMCALKSCDPADCMERGLKEDPKLACAMIALWPLVILAMVVVVMWKLIRGEL